MLRLLDAAPLDWRAYRSASSYVFRDDIYVRNLNMPLRVHKNSPYQFLSKQCMVCQQQTTNRCSQCGLAYYCDNKCQKQDFVLHKELCLTTTKNLDCPIQVDPSIQENYEKCSKNRRQLQRNKIFADILLNGQQAKITLETAANHNDVALFRFLLYCAVIPQNIKHCYKPTNQPIQFKIIEQLELCATLCNALMYNDLLCNDYLKYQYQLTSDKRYLADIKKYLKTHEINDTNENFYNAMLSMRRDGVVPVTNDKVLGLLTYFVERGYVTKIPETNCLLHNADDHFTLLSWKVLVSELINKRTCILQNEVGRVCIPVLCDVVVSYL